MHIVSSAQNYFKQNAVRPYVRCHLTTNVGSRGEHICSIYASYICPILAVRLPRGGAITKLAAICSDIGDKSINLNLSLRAALLFGHHHLSAFVVHTMCVCVINVTMQLGLHKVHENYELRS